MVGFSSKMDLLHSAVLLLSCRLDPQVYPLYIIQRYCHIATLPYA